MVITTVPARYPGAFRRVYPGFLQLAGFLSMNLDRHVEAHWRMFRHLVEGDGDSAAATRAFYDEYSSVMDLPADFYLQTVERVFQRQDLAHGRFRVRGELGRSRRDRAHRADDRRGRARRHLRASARPTRRTGCAAISRRQSRPHHLQPRVGHYGVFHGRRWNEEIYPKVAAFIRRHDSAGNG